MQFFATEALGPTQSLTPEGYLVCQSVPIARLGIQEYAAGELGNEIAPDSRGIVAIERSADEVFRPESVASFAGKPVIMSDHQMLDARTWKTRIVGVVLNPRRGDGVLEDRLVADLMIYDEIAANAIRNGQRQVSCGYYADYEETSPGHGRQVNIIGNHLALVEQGRCGPSCAIGDSDMAATGSKEKAGQKARWLDRLRAAITLGDETKIEEVMGEGVSGPGEGAAGVTVNLHMGAGDPKVGDQEGTEGGEGGNKEPTLADVMAAIAAIGARVAKIEGMERKEAESEKTGDEETDEQKAARMAKEEEDKKAKEGTGDSAALADVFQTARTGAEILVPGIAMPAFDTKAKPGATIDAICALRREALKKFGDSAEGKVVIEKMGLSTIDIASAHCDAISAAFGVAVAAKRSIPAHGGQITYPKTGTGDYKRRTIADINKANRERYGFPVNA